MINGKNSIIVKTDIFEMTGSEKNVYFTINNSKCVAKVPLDYPFDNNIELRIDSENLYFFDIDNGICLN
jgi:hypothetical protein